MSADTEAAFPPFVGDVNDAPVDMRWAVALAREAWRDDPRAQAEEDDKIALSRAAMLWATLFGRADNPARVAHWLGLSAWADDMEDDYAVFETIMDMGACAMRDEERGERSECLALPVTNCGFRECGATLSIRRAGTYDFVDAIDDLICIGNGLADSLMKSITHVGEIGPGRAVLYARGRAWIDALAASVRRHCADAPPCVVAKLHPFAPPGVLMVQPELMEWRPGKLGAAVGKDCGEIVCADSAGLAKLIGDAMRKKDRAVKPPIVKGPKT